MLRLRSVSGSVSAACVVVLAAVACSLGCGARNDDRLGVEGDGGPASDDAAPPSLEDACAAWARSACTRADACSAARVSTVWGSVAECEARLAIACELAATSPFTGLTVAALAACATDTVAASCADLAARSPPTTCRPTGGTVANGGSCGDDWACQSGRCQKAADHTCGTCIARPGAGGACLSEDDCAYGMTCLKTGTCAVFVARGDSCNDARPCAPDLVCKRPNAVVGGTCATAPSAGSLCEQHAAQDEGCDTYAGAYCNRASGRCESVVVASAGDGCGVTAGGYALCAEGTCAAASGTCVAELPDGAPCVAGAAPCKPGSICSGGTCIVPDPASCK